MIGVTEKLSGKKKKNYDTEAIVSKKTVRNLTTTPKEEFRVTSHGLGLFKPQLVNNWASGNGSRYYTKQKMIIIKISL